MSIHKNLLIGISKLLAFFVGFCAGAAGGVLGVAYFVGRNEPRLMGIAIWTAGPVLGIILFRWAGRLLDRSN